MPAEVSWDVLFENMPWFWFIAIGGWAVVAVVQSIMDNWRKVRVAEQTAALKQSMVEKGMSAADIEAVLKAGVSTPRKLLSWQK